MVWTLVIDNNSENINFLSTDDVEVMNAGFDLGPIRKRSNISVVRSGPFYAPTKTEYEPRQATIKFRVFGSNRSVIIGKINKLERILQTVERRERINAGGRVELRYAWDGTSNITYLEVLQGDPNFPPDILSVERLHAKGGTSGTYFVELTLELIVSPFGYGISIFSDVSSSQEVPLKNSGSKTTGGVFIENMWYDTSEHFDYVEIEASDLVGAHSYLAVIKAYADSAQGGLSRWNSMYIGHKVSPFPAKRRWEASEFIDHPGTLYTGQGSSYSNGDYYGNTYPNQSTPIFSDVLPDWYIQVDPAQSRGLHYIFLHNGETFKPELNWAIGFADFIQQGILDVGEFVGVKTSSYYVMPLGPLSIPPNDDLFKVGSNFFDLAMSFFIGLDPNSPIVVKHDFVSAIPINDGLRIWRCGLSSSANNDDLEGFWVDNPWLGVHYLDRKDGLGFTTPFYPLLEPITLVPNKNQRLYFKSLGSSVGATEGARKFKIQVYAVPIYKTLAK